MRNAIVLAILLAAGVGCKKAFDGLEKQGYGSGNPPEGQQGGPYSGGGNPTVGGAGQAVRGAVNRTVTAAELKDLHLFMKNAQLASGRVPTSQETMAALSQADGNPKLLAMIRDQTIILMPSPQEEGLWAYAKEAPTQGGWILTHSQPERVTAQEFASRFNSN